MGRAMLDLAAVFIVIAVVAAAWVAYSSTRGGARPPRVTRTTRSFGWVLQVLVGMVLVVAFLGIIFTMIRVFFLQNN